MQPIGKTTRVEAELGRAPDHVQRRAGSVFANAAAIVQARGALAGPDVHAVAARGVAGNGGRLPHLETIQRSFGRHDIRDVRAHIGGDSAAAARAIGASAYATGNSVAFAATPDLHLAAHEAAHVVQQRYGVQVSAGVGSAGDEYERHADAVADLVVQGASAEALLDQIAHRGGGRGGSTVQRDERRRPAATEASQVSLSSLHPSAIAHVIRAIAGGVGETRKVEITICIPIPEIPNLTVGGKLTVEVAHSIEGYKLAVTPRLRCGLQTSERAAGGNGERTGDASLFAELTTEVRGHTPELAARLLVVALDHTLRASERQLPTFFVVALSTTPVGAVVLAADAFTRMYEGIHGRPPVSPFWPWLANHVFGGEQRQAATRAAMTSDDYAETRDRPGFEANIRPARGASGSVSIAAEDRWRVEGEDGEVERDYDTTVTELQLAVSPFTAKVKYTKPAHNRRVFGGEVVITLTADGRLAGFGTALLANHVLGQVFAAIAAATDPAMRAPMTEADHASGAMVTALQEVLATQGQQTAKLILELTVPLRGRPMSARVRFADEARVEAEGNGLRLTSSRDVWRWTGPVIGARR